LGWICMMKWRGFLGRIRRFWRGRVWCF